MQQDKGALVKIPILDLKGQYRGIQDEIRSAIDEILESQQFILGPVVEKFEAEVAAYLRSGAAIGVASGSDALLLSLMALGIGPGDAVLVPPFTFFASVSCITRLGATPIFIDIDPETFLLDPGAVEAFVEGRARPAADGRGLVDPKSQCRIKALLPVHLFGQCCPMTVLLAQARKHNLAIVEDVAQAFGAREEIAPGPFKAAGTLGEFGCFSFFPTKNLGGLGDGGMVVTGRSDLAEAVRRLRVHGANHKYHHLEVGLNSRLDALQAAVLRVKLRYVDQWCEERIERARRYRALFLATGLVGKQILSLPNPSDGRSHVFNQYVLRASRRDELRAYLGEQGIMTAVYYPVPLHLQPCFAFLGYRQGEFPHAERAADEVLALPMFPELTQEEQEIVVKRIKAFYRR
ncbi:MAG: DegT/DnrJ/EryC1/StrS family aminotransferase [Deltaproteobacteria bacterium]|nr:DegT/DnrJ/EryC1/StrS family aminotransferase [Deltaproteobacteria bacterium]